MRHLYQVVQGCQIVVASPEVRVSTGTEILLFPLSVQGETQIERDEAHVGGTRQRGTTLTRDHCCRWVPVRHVSQTVQAGQIVVASSEVRMSTGTAIPLFVVQLQGETKIQSGQTYNDSAWYHPVWVASANFVKLLYY